MKYVSKYLDVPNDALFPFGHGLSYTTFAYSDMKVSASSIRIAALNRNQNVQPLKASATVKNEGHVRATEIVQCYVRVRGASIEQPIRSLKGFRRVTLEPGESKTVEFPLGFQELSFYNVESRAVVEPADYTVWIGGSSTAKDSAQFKTTP